MPSAAPRRRTPGDRRSRAVPELNARRLSWAEDGQAAGFAGEVTAGPGSCFGRSRPALRAIIRADQTVAHDRGDDSRALPMKVLHQLGALLLAAGVTVGAVALAQSTAQPAPPPAKSNAKPVAVKTSPTIATHWSMLLPQHKTGLQSTRDIFCKSTLAMKPKRGDVWLRIYRLCSVWRGHGRSMSLV